MVPSMLHFASLTENLTQGFILLDAKCLNFHPLTVHTNNEVNRTAEVFKVKHIHFHFTESEPRTKHLINTKNIKNTIVHQTTDPSSPVSYLSWLLHGNLSMEVYVVQFIDSQVFVPSIERGRPWCMHIWSVPGCQLSSTFSGCVFSHTSNSIYIPSVVPKKFWDFLVSFFLTIYHTRKESLAAGVPGNCGSVFLSPVCTHLQAGFHWALYNDSLCFQGAVNISQRSLLGVLTWHLAY